MWKPDPWTIVRDLARWPVTTQFQARRNALLACTALAQRRRERDEVEEYLDRMKPLVGPQPAAFSPAANSRGSTSS
jgi:hypothetical protein